MLIKKLKRHNKYYGYNLMFVYMYICVNLESLYRKALKALKNKTKNLPNELED